MHFLHFLISFDTLKFCLNYLKKTDEIVSALYSSDRLLEATTYVGMNILFLFNTKLLSFNYMKLFTTKCRRLNKNPYKKWSMKLLQNSFLCKTNTTFHCFPHADTLMLICYKSRWTFQKVKNFLIPKLVWQLLQRVACLRSLILADTMVLYKTSLW